MSRSSSGTTRTSGHAPCGSNADPADLLAVFGAPRTADVALWRRSRTAERARLGRHLERGSDSYELMFRMLADHDRVHQDQARRTLAILRERG